MILLLHYRYIFGRTVTSNSRSIRRSILGSSFAVVVSSIAMSLRCYSPNPRSSYHVASHWQMDTEKLR